MNHNKLLTLGELREQIKDLPDDVGCRIGEIRYDEKDEDFRLTKSSPIHTVEYEPIDGEYAGLLIFHTHYTREGVLGIDDGKIGLDKWK